MERPTQTHRIQRRAATSLAPGSPAARWHSRAPERASGASSGHVLKTRLGHDDLLALLSQQPEQQSQVRVLAKSEVHTQRRATRREGNKVRCSLEKWAHS